MVATVKPQQFHPRSPYARNRNWDDENWLAQAEYLSSALPLSANEFPADTVFESPMAVSVSGPSVQTFYIAFDG